MARRFFIDQKDIKNNQVVLTGDQHHHLKNVLRSKVGDKFLVSDQNFSYECSVFEIKKDQTTLNIILKQAHTSLLDVTLFQAIMKNEHMDFLVQKTTELGINKIVPFLSKFTVVKPDDKKRTRLFKIAIEASKQSGREKPTEIEEPKSFAQTLDMLKDYSQIVVAYEKETNPAKEVLKSFDKNKKTAIIVGSEGGFSEEEITKLKQVGAKVISLGKNILRGETAGITLSALVLYEFDEFKV